MIEYQKIEAIYKFNPKTHKYLPEFYNPIVEYLKDLPWIASEKIDGTNIRVHWDGHRVEWNGRTDNADLPKPIQDLLAATFGESEIVFEQRFGEKDVILFMECYGGKVQGGLYGGSERLIGFDVMVNGVYLDKMAIGPIFDDFQVTSSEFFRVNGLDEAIARVREHRRSVYAEPESQDTYEEGLVCVPAYRLYDHQGKRIIVKIKYRDLIKMVD